MINRSLTEKIRSAALAMGMDLVGFGPVRRWKDAPYLLSPQAILPKGNTVIVTGIHTTDTWIEMGGEPTPHDVGPGGWMDQNSLLDRVAFRLTRILNKYGYKAIAVASSNIWRYRKMEGIESLFAPDLSHIHASAAAGLTQIGWSGLAISPEYGPRVRYISIVTSAELEPTPMYNGPDLCDMCMECVRHCPSQALKKDFNGPPHVVAIEGKTFRYANKNIWRCAWAEHFNLDLNSPTLDKDHIDESDVIGCVNAGELKGHERGVCQKWCIPKHLRSEEPSFGRPDKKITMKKVQRKYPADMPTYKKMRDDIIARAVSMGVDLAAAAPIDRENPAFEVVEREAPGMTTALAFAMRIPAETRDACALNSYTAQPYQYALRTKMHHIMLVTAKMTEEFGYHATAYTGSVPSSPTMLQDALAREKETGRQGHELVAARLAEMCGIGKIDGEFTTPEFGENVILGVIATDAPLDALSSAGYEYREPAAPASPRLLKNKLAALAEENLADLFGTAKAETLDNLAGQLSAVLDDTGWGDDVFDSTGKPHGRWISEVAHDDVRIRRPSDYLPGAKSVITLGMTLPNELIENAGERRSMQIGTYGYHTYQTTYELYFAAVELAGFLNRSGFHAMVTSNLLGVGSKVDTPRGLLPDFRCSALEAVACGLGEIGKNGGLLTPEAGAQQRCITIITDAELPADSVYSGEKLCTGCESCLSGCPMGALGRKVLPLDVNGVLVEYPLVDRNRCDWAKRYSLSKDEGPELIGNMIDVKAPEGEVSIQDIIIACNTKDQVFKHRTVVLERCLKECPAGRKP